MSKLNPNVVKCFPSRGAVNCFTIRQEAVSALLLYKEPVLSKDNTSRACPHRKAIVSKQLCFNPIGYGTPHVKDLVFRENHMTIITMEYEGEVQKSYKHYELHPNNYHISEYDHLKNVKEIDIKE